MKKNLQHLFHTYIYIFFLRETSGKQNNRQYRNKFSKPEKQVIICTLWFLYKWCICIIKSVTHSSNTYIHCQTQLSFIKICLVHWNSSITELFKKKKKKTVLKDGKNPFLTFLWMHAASKEKAFSIGRVHLCS